MTDEEVSNKLVEHEQRIKVCERREADLEEQSSTIQQLALNTHDLAVNMADMSTVQKHQGDRIDAIEKAPMAAWSRILWIIATALLGIAVGYFWSIII